MSQISNEKEFEDNLKKLGDLYEEAKDIVNKLVVISALALDAPPLSDGQRLYSILQQMRDLAAIQMQHKHWLNEN